MSKWIKISTWLLSCLLIACNGGDGGDTPSQPSSPGSEADAIPVSVQITPTPAGVPVGLHRSFKATAVYADDTTKDVTTESAWQSSNPSIASINARGEAVGIAAGNSDISATLNTEAGKALTAQTELMVKGVGIVDLQLSALYKEGVPRGLTQRLTAVAVFDDNSTEDITGVPSLHWVSSNANVAAIVGSGLIRAEGPGKSIITVSGEVAGKPFTASTELVVSDAEITGIQIITNEVAVAQRQLANDTSVSASVSQHQPSTVQASWSSESQLGILDSTDAPVLDGGSSNSPVTLSSSLLGLAADTTLMTLSADESASAPQPMARDDDASVPVGLHQGFIVLATLSNGTTLDITDDPALSWGSSNPAVATVSATQGDAIGLAPGTTTITLSLRLGADTYNTAIELTVSDVQVTGLQVIPAAASLAKGLHQQFSVTATLSDSTSRDLTDDPLVSWVSGDLAIATVSSSQSSGNGQVTGVSAGTTTIKATGNIGGKLLSASGTLSVTDLTVTRLSVTPATVSILPASQQQLVVMETLADGSARDVTQDPAISWVSSDPEVATVSSSQTGSSNGVVIALKAGSSTITASRIVGSAAFTANSTLTVSEKAKSYTASTALQGQGTIQPISLTITEGQTGSFSLTPASGQRILDVTGCSGVLSGTQFTTGGMSADCTVTVRFGPVSYTASAVAQGAGTIQPSTLVLEHGQIGTFTISADVGHVVASVSGCGVAKSGENQYSTSGMSGDCVLTASFAPAPIIVPPTMTASTTIEGQGTVTPSSLTLEQGQVGNFTVTPAPGNKILGVTGCAGFLNGPQFTTGAVGADCVISVRFAPVTYVANTAVNGEGLIEPPSQLINHGQTGTFTVTAKPGYTLGSISGCGGSQSGNSYTTAALTADCTVAVSFKLASYTVTSSVNGAGGTITPASQASDAGTTVTLTLTPEANYAIDTVTGCGGALSGNTYTTAALGADCRVAASFKLASYTVTGSVTGAGGTITPASQASDAGATVTLTLTPEANYVIDTVSGCGGALSGNTYTTAALGADCSVAASFKMRPHIATAQLGIGGLLNPSFLELEEGQIGAFTFQPDPGYAVATVSGCEGTFIEDQHASQYTIGPMSADCTVAATFMPNAEHAILHEDHTLATADELLSYARQQVPLSQAKRIATLNGIYQGIAGPVTYTPGDTSVYFTNQLADDNVIVVPANRKGSVDYPGREAGLVVAGEQAGQRYVAMARTPFTGGNPLLPDDLLRNLVTWLTKGKIPTAADMLKVRRFRNQNANLDYWLRAAYPGIVDVTRCNTISDINACVAEKPDLIVVGTYLEGQDSAAVQAAMAQAKILQIPIMVIHDAAYDPSPQLIPLYQRMGLKVTMNFWDKFTTAALPVSELLTGPDKLQKADELLANLQSGTFDTVWLAGCNGANFINCTNPTFIDRFKEGADYFRDTSEFFDMQGIDAFTQPDRGLLLAGLLLADKYRADIDYPIAWSETGTWQHALFADWAVHYSRLKNLAQPDLGEYVWDRSQVQKGSQANYTHPATLSETRTISVPYPNQWTTTGWYALPGQVVTLTRTDASSASVVVKLNYHRPNTNRAYERHVYYGPLELSTQRLSLATGQSIQFSSPYGGPIYLYLGDSGSSVLSVDVTAGGVAHHPTIRDFSSFAEIDSFSQLLTNTELPHVDLRTDGAELHARRDRFENSIAGRTPTVQALLESISNDHLNSVYTLAGLKIQGKTLDESLPLEVVTACTNLFGATDCLDETLHTRTLIQHANYDQEANCGGGCSGNPWDASWSIDPAGWGDNHELGHNLQVNLLNMNYIAAADSENWSKYSNRAQENSNNIFPFYVKWKTHYITDNDPTPIIGNYVNYKDIFYAYMSDVAAIKNSGGSRVVLNAKCQLLDVGSDRYEAIWAGTSYAENNNTRFAIYILMALRAHGMALSDGTVLTSGYDLYTLLYQYQRIFGKYDNSQALWDANKARLGFDLFPYSGGTVYGGKNVSGMPGNDFMLVALAKLTGFNWQSTFDLVGLRYTSLAAAQAAANATKGTLPLGVYSLETGMPPSDLSAGLTFVPLSAGESGALWPVDNSSPTQCPILP